MDARRYKFPFFWEGIILLLIVENDRLRRRAKELMRPRDERPASHSSMWRLRSFRKRDDLFVRPVTAAAEDDHRHRDRRDEADADSDADDLDPGETGRAAERFEFHQERM